MATVHVPPQMRDLTAGAAEVEIDGRNLRAVIAALDARFPGFQARVVVAGRLSPGIAVSIDHVVTSLGLIARVGETSVIHFVPAIAGGT